jgi:predicted RNA-binding protein with TRAM domain
MLRSFKALVVVSALAAGTLIVLTPNAAHAHAERRAGAYTLAIGWGSEPAYAGIANSVQVLLSRDEKPVNDLGDTLKVEVSNGGQTKSLSFEPNFEVGEFGTEGDYRAWITPTVPGKYTFHLTGTIKGTRVNVSITSGEDTFDDIHDPAEIQFPAKEPSGIELTTRLDRELPRIDAQIAAAKKSAADDASSARAMAIIALALGGVGAVLGALNLMRKR